MYYGPQVFLSYQATRLVNFVIAVLQISALSHYPNVECHDSGRDQ